MKPYFAKYLPVPGEIKEGDLMFMIGSPTLLRAGGDNFNNSAYTKVKLLLCSRDIQVGDMTRSTINPDLDELKALSVNDGKVLLAGEEEFEVELNRVFKVIGEISPEAIWVKEGDEFDEDQVRVCEWDDGDEFVIPVKEFKEGKQDSYKIEIKGPCGHFH